MKVFLVTILIFISVVVHCQHKVPVFLEGTWKIEDTESFEHWDKINDLNLRGFSYTLDDKIFKITEYLEISQVEDIIKYKATVLNQNSGNTIEFKMTQSGNTLVFENPDHDFPKMIKYQILSKDLILVEISDGKNKVFNYKLFRK